jgi:hypothetical protein
LDRHHLEGGKQLSFIEAALGGEAREMPRDLLGYGLGRDTRGAVRRGEDEAGAAADQRGEDDVRVSDDFWRQRNRP